MRPQQGPDGEPDWEEWVKRHQKDPDTAYQDMQDRYEDQLDRQMRDRD